MQLEKKMPTSLNRYPQVKKIYIEKHNTKKEVQTSLLNLGVQFFFAVA